MDLHDGMDVPAYGDRVPHEEKPGQEMSSEAMVAVIDPRVLIRECIATCLETSIGQTVETYATLSEWAGDATDRPPAALILMCLYGQKTISEQIEQIDRDRAKFPAKLAMPPIVFISEQEDISEIVSALDSGAKGYIPTSVSLDITVEALNLVRAGGVFVPASSLLSAKRMLTSISSEPKSPLAGIFTERQAAVVEAIRQGKANKTIAYELNMHESTVKVHVRNIMKKLKAQNRTQVAYLTHNLLQNASN
ncbi:LuxR C-terminal-related transcriptional regulator [Aliihoeflea sp. PC F10.4]